MSGFTTCLTKCAHRTHCLLTPSVSQVVRCSSYHQTMPSVTMCKVKCSWISSGRAFALAQGHPLICKYFLQTPLTGGKQPPDVTYTSALGTRPWRQPLTWNYPFFFWSHFFFHEWPMKIFMFPPHRLPLLKPFEEHKRPAPSCLLPSGHLPTVSSTTLTH